MRRAAADKGWPGFHGPVQYYDPATFHMPEVLQYMSRELDDAEAKEIIENLAFRKQHSFVYEREFRFVILANTDGQEAVKLEIGNIGDIAKESTLTLSGLQSARVRERDVRDEYSAPARHAADELDGESAEPVSEQRRRWMRAFTVFGDQLPPRGGAGGKIQFGRVPSELSPI